MRTEKDSMGEIKVPDDAYYGAQTKRASDNFQVSNLTIPKPMINAIAVIKRSAAIVNCKLGLLDNELKDSIIKTCDEIIEGKFDNQFIVDIYQTGSGTSTNMNMNEIISNRACELLGSNKGDKSVIHPNDHVNLGQSSNDVIPTSIHISSILEIKNRLLPELELLSKSLEKKSKDFDKIIKIGRTHLQDATPITLGQEFSGFASMVRSSIERIKSNVKELYELAQGGTAVGTGINTHKDFSSMVISEISSFSGETFFKAKNHFELQSTQDRIIQMSGTLKTLAVSLYKISNDIRWLGSGPRSGLGELILPSVQPGSSIMPGKVNPVICESLIQVCSQVIGYDHANTIGGLSGMFQLNLMLPLIGHNILESIAILSNATKMFRVKLVDGLLANEKKCKEYIEGSLAMCTALVPKIGYDKAAEIAKKAYKTDKTIREIAIEENILSKDELDSILDPNKMV